MPGTTGRSGDCRQEKAPVRPGLFFSHAALQTTDAVIVREIIHVLGVLVMCARCSGKTWCAMITGWKRRHR
jgi:cytochrome b